MLSNIEIQNILPHRYPFLLIGNIKFRRKVLPSDALTLEAELLSCRLGTGKATFNEDLAASGEISFMVTDDAKNS